MAGKGVKTPGFLDIENRFIKYKIRNFEKKKEYPKNQVEYAQKDGFPRIKKEKTGCLCIADPKAKKEKNDRNGIKCARKNTG